MLWDFSYAWSSHSTLPSNRRIAYAFEFTANRGVRRVAVSRGHVLAAWCA